LNRLNPQQKKILFLQHDSIFEKYGGVQYYIDDFLNSLAQIYGRECVHSLLARRTDHFELKPRPYEIEVIRLKSGVLKRLQNRFSLKFFFKSLSSVKRLSPSVLIASHLSLAPQAAVISKITGIPFLVIAYGFEVWGKFQPQDKWALEKADGLISISYWTRDRLIQQGFNPKKISVVHPGVSPDMLAMSSQIEELSKSTTADKPLKLLTVGRLDSEEQYKGHDHVIEALKILVQSHPNLNLSYTIVGEGTDLPRLQDKVKNYHLEGRVQFLPAVKQREALKNIYSTHDLFVMPSRFGFWDGRWRGEGFGIVYVESALFGVPTLAYRCGGVTDIVESEKSGILVDPDNIPQLASAIFELSQDRKKLRTLGNNAQKRARELFTPAPIETEVKQALESFLCWNPNRA
jgi:phosphatidyl-myo-inositol dimannoside synthase